MSHLTPELDGAEVLPPGASDIAILTADLKAHRPTYLTYRNYYDGEQPIRFAGEKLQHAFGEELNELVCNRVAPAVDAVADRLQIQGFTTTSGAANDRAAEIWQRNGMDRVHGEVHTEALTAGDGYVLVWPDADGKALMYVQRAEWIAVDFDLEHPGELRVAAKAWRLADKRWRLNLYYRDRLEKYITHNAIDEPNAPDNEKLYEPFIEDNEAWPVPYDQSWTGTVPIFHFANNGRTGEYGRSEVKALMSLQNRLNMTLANLAIAEEFQSYRQRWATGLQLILDPETGKPVSPFTAGAGQLWVSPNEAAKFGDFEAANLEMFSNTAEGHEIRMARTARIPLYHLLQAGAPESGEALKTAEEPFVKKVLDRMRSFGPVWEAAMGHALKIEGTEPDVRVNWARAETRNEREFWELSAIKREMGVSPQQILREYGYSDDEIEQFKAELAEHTETMMGMAAQAFNQGSAINERPADAEDADTEDAR